MSTTGQATDTKRELQFFPSLDAGRGGQCAKVAMHLDTQFGKVPTASILEQNKNKIRDFTVAFRPASDFYWGSFRCTHCGEGCAHPDGDMVMFDPDARGLWYSGQSTMFYVNRACLDPFLAECRRYAGSQ